MIFDTHAHYDDEAFDKDRDELLNSFQENHIEGVVGVGASLQTSKNTLELIKKYSFMYGAIGVHPSETAELNDDNIGFLMKHIKDEKVVALGEIGLDYYWDTPEKEVQIMWFKKQLSIALEADVPVIIHSRDAAADTLSIMKETRAYALKNGKNFRGVIHCFSYGTDMATEYVKMGFYLGIGGVITFKNGKKLKEVVAEIPMEHIVLETDCPYLAPEPNRGKRNSSLNLFYVAECIAKIKGISIKEVITITTENAKKLYEIKK